MPNILVIDDEPAILHAFRRVFRGSDFTLNTASSAAEALQAIAQATPDVVVLDVHLPDAKGLEAFRKLRSANSRIPIILITGHGTTDLAIEAIKEGAFDFILKPLELNDVREVIDRAMRSIQIMQVPVTIPNVPASAGPSNDLLVGRCAAMQQVYKAIGRVAATDESVLILGESGTGKELVARALHQHSLRARQPFIAINCGAIPETLIESELFGHEKGAFTGAERRRIGKLEQASGGTIFLDEIGEMPPLAQVRLLRVLQEQQFERVGGNETVTTNLRVLAATNVELESAVIAGRFRKDLYFRLNVFTITLPPLRERDDDLQLLIEHYLRRFTTELGRTIEQIDPVALAALRAYPWPGNVRELQSILKQAVLHARGPVLLADFLPAQVLTKPAISKLPGVGTGFDWDRFVEERIAAGSESLHAEGQSLMEREVLMRVLQHTSGNQLQAAKILGITRGSLRTKIRQLGIVIERGVWSNSSHPDA